MMLLQILKKIGFEPIRATANSYQYKSPFNPNEKTPSFFVFQNTNSGEWTNFKDYSSGKGGDIYKFIMEYFHIDFKLAKQKLRELTGENYQELKRPTPIKAPLSSFNQSKENNYKIKKTSKLKNRALIDYLKERGLEEIELHQRFIGEIYYAIDDKNYFAISFINEAGGREIRNKYFKGSFGKKDISLILPNPKDRRIKIFEGFIDFLSYLEINKKAPLSNYLILNSVSLRERGLNAIRGKYEAYELYLDNDKSGDESTQFFKDNLDSASDKRVHYKSYKDLNEFLVAKNS